MFRNFQRKYLFTSIAVLTAIIAAALIVLNAAFQHLQTADTERMLSLILRTGGSAERLLPEAQQAADTGVLLPDTAESGYLDMKTSSYFLVRTSGETITSVDVRSAYGLDEAKARALAVMVLSLGKNSGREGRYAYLRQVGPTGSVYAFLDVSGQLLAEARLMTVSVAAGALAEALMLVYVWFMTVRCIRPAEALLEASSDIMEKSAAGMDAGAAYLLSAYRDRGGASPALQEGIALAGIATDLRGVAGAIARHEKPQTVNLSAVLLETAAENASRFTERDLEVHTAVEEGVTVWARPEELRALFEILMDNACEQGMPGGEVFLDLLSDSGNAGAVLRYAVRELPDLAPAQLLNGKLDGTSGVSGGLYAARLLAKLNRGELACEYLEPPAVCFTVRFRRRGR